jgi:hypothetical protein
VTLNKSAPWIGNTVVVSGVILAGWVLLYSGMPQDVRDWIDTIPWLIGSILPYVLMYFGLRTLREEVLLWSIAFVTTVFLVVCANFALLNGLVWRRSSMSAVLLVVIPFYQIVIFGLVFLVLLLVRKVIRSRLSGA